MAQETKSSRKSVARNVTLLVVNTSYGKKRKLADIDSLTSVYATREASTLLRSLRLLLWDQP